MMFRGIGQAPESPVTGTAAWLSSVCAILSKDSTFGPILNDPYARYFAEAISSDAPTLLGKYDDEAVRSAFIEERERERPGSLTVVAYRKPQMERLVREALSVTGASQLVIMGVGCDTLALRLAQTGVTPAVFEIDRPAVIGFRKQVFQKLPLDHSHISGVGVDFAHQTFGRMLIESGYDPEARTVFFAEGLLGYLPAEAVDEIFAFVKDQARGPSRFVFSFTESRRADAARPVPSSAALALQGEEPLFDLPPSQAKAFVEARGLKLVELLTADDLRNDYRSRHGGRIRIVPFMHLGVAES